MSESISLRTRVFETGDLELVGAWLRAEGLGVPIGASRKLWGQRLRRDPRIVYRGGLVGGELIGCYRLDVGTDGCAEVTVLVAPDMRRRGLGTRLLDEALRKARELGLRRLVAEVQEMNRGALSFFVEAGFEDTGRRGSGFVQLERIVHRSSGQSPLEITP